MLLLIITTPLAVAGFYTCYRLVEVNTPAEITSEVKLKRFFCSFSCIIGLLSALCIFFMVLGVILNLADLKFQKVKHAATREDILSRIEYGYCGTQGCVSDAVDYFNESIEYSKKLDESKWIGFMFFDSYEDCEPINPALAEGSLHNACPHNKN